jgi:hypothetical protein
MPWKLSTYPAAEKNIFLLDAGNISFTLHTYMYIYMFYLMLLREFRTMQGPLIDDS